MKNRTSFKVIYLDKNQGHGNARRIGLTNCSNELVALMDADDLSLPNRFYYQLKAFSENKEVDIVGGQITEFIGNPTNIIGKREVPEDHESIKKFMKKRCPMNQVSVMFKKSSVENAGGYLDWYCEEDYYLWIRMILNGNKFMNVPETLVNVRIGDEMSARRGGLKYFKSEKKIQKLLFKKGFINIFRYIYNVMIRFFGEVILPSKLRTRLFKRLRSHKFESFKEKTLDLSDSHVYEPFSVSMCVYSGDNGAFFDESLESIFKQSVLPSEIVLVVDGPINNGLQNIINKWEIKMLNE